MGALGPVGLTAWVGLFAVGEANAGETVLVSAAAGATGSTVVQLAGGGVPGGGHGGRRRTRHRSCANWARMRWWIIAPSRVIWAALDAVAPEGFDVYFDNIGGPTLDAVLPGCAKKGASHSAA
jgi:NADPH-dependent curcumin reductase CurA